MQMAALRTVHTGKDWEIDWEALAALGPAPVPVRDSAAEDAIRLAIKWYVPSLLERLFGKDKHKLSRLQSNLAQARIRDEHEHERRLRGHWRRLGIRSQRAALARGVLEGDQTIIEQLTQRVAPIMPFYTGAAGVDLVTAVDSFPTVCTKAKLSSLDVVPDEQVYLGKRGNALTKPMTRRMRSTAIQDYVCGIGLRIARDLVDFIGAETVSVDVILVAPSTSTGHEEERVLLSVKFAADRLRGLILDAVDPSDCVQANLEHSMSYSKTAGLQTVSSLWDN
ncbi:MAG: hypothetical protein ACE5JX_19770 [Acidobacteriota bacterium]